MLLMFIEGSCMSHAFLLCSAYSVGLLLLFHAFIDILLIHCRAVKDHAVTQALLVLLEFL